MVKSTHREIRGRSPAARSISRNSGSSTERCESRVADMQRSLGVFFNSDSRVHSPVQKADATLFTRFFKSENPIDVREIRDNLRYLSSALHSLNRRSFFVVPQSVVQANEGEGVLAFSRFGEPRVHVSEEFFTVENRLTKKDAGFGDADGVANESKSQDRDD